jgi:hypothetical protein
MLCYAYATHFQLSYNGLLMYTTTIIHLPHINHLLPSCSCNLIWQLLACQRFPRRLDDVHLVARTRGLCGEILQTGSTRKLEDEMLGAKTETYQMLR